MKNFASTLILIAIAITFFTGFSNAQAPEGFVYQAEIRNDKGRIQSNTDIIMDIRILNQTEIVENSVWKRIYHETTDKYGMVSVIVGEGEYSEGIPFNEINWGNGTYYLYVEVDGISMGDPVMLMSVPYSLYSNTAGYAREAGNAINTENLNNGDIIQYTENGFVAASFHLYYQDKDGDNYGNDLSAVYSPEILDGYSINPGDCNDNDPQINPDIDEVCDQIDNDCDGLVDEGFDLDSDGYTTCQGDCDDNDSSVYPGAVEICGDNVDQDCDGSDLLCPEDIDNDGDGMTENQGDCDDSNPNIPGGPCDGSDSDNCLNGIWICNPITGVPECSEQGSGNIEICNEIDDDCDGAIDEDFNFNTDVNNCGACGAACGEGYVCVGGLCQAIDGDNDGSPMLEDCNDADPNINPDAEDFPDVNYTDSNCDGIDGDASKAVFVSKSGSDSNNGTLESPMLTINGAIATAASNQKQHVYISVGTYSERVIVSSGISLFGGYNSENNWSRSNSNLVKITGVDQNNHVSAVEANDISMETYINMLTINTEDATGAATDGRGKSNYAMICKNSPGLIISNCILESGNGSIGLAGTNGINGLNGNSGANGANGACDANINASGGNGGVSNCGHYGGKGGNGLYEQSGLRGENSLDGVPGGNGGSSGNPGLAGQNGTNGYIANNGINGFGGNSGIASDYWLGNNGTDGSNGSDGYGGGGGGAGGGQTGTIFFNGTGNAGGGGGAGGCRGTAGLGGKAGGGSFGLYIVNTNNLQIVECIITSGNGGNGGNGGAGGIGGTGGQGGAGGNFCTDEIGAGGNGGNGSKGGNGGNGGGGAGGPSFGIVTVSSTIINDSNTINAGYGGVGGTTLNNANNGSSGETVNVKSF